MRPAGMRDRGEGKPLAKSKPYDEVFPDDLDLETTRMQYTYVNIHHIQVGVHKHVYMQTQTPCMGVCVLHVYMFMYNHLRMV